MEGGTKAKGSKQEEGDEEKGAGKKLVDVVNATGFPLQLALARAVEVSEDVSQAWAVRHIEHHWHHPSTDEDGFIDLVFTQRDGVAELAVECKRVKNTAWIFLQPKSALNTATAKALVSMNEPHRRVIDWFDVEVIQSSPQSQFCAIPGLQEGSRTTLEKTAATAVASIEALAADDTQYKFAEVSASPMRLYFPVVVTNAPLKLCVYDPKTLNVADGELKGEFSNVPFVRFRKQLSANPSRLQASGFDLKHYMVSNAKESTVFVVGSAHFVNFLRYFKVNSAKLVEIDKYVARMQL